MADVVSGRIPCRNLMLSIEAFELSVPDVDFIVAPRQKYTALHAAIVLRVRHGPEGDMCSPTTPYVLLEALLGEVEIS